MSATLLAERLGDCDGGVLQGHAYLPMRQDQLKKCLIATATDSALLRR